MGPTETASASDEVIDAIADIEMKRQETEKEAGFAMSCSSALHRLNELLEHETEALRLRGPDSGHQENVQAVTIEIGRVKELAAVDEPASQARPGSTRAPSNGVVAERAAESGQEQGPQNDGAGRRSLMSDA